MLKSKGSALKETVHAVTFFGEKTMTAYYLNAVSAAQAEDDPPAEIIRFTGNVLTTQRYVAQLDWSAL